MSARDFFGVVGRRRRRSSVISLFSHRDGPVKKIKFSPFFKNKQSFQNSRFLGKMSARDFFCCCRSSVISLFRHRDGPVKKIKFSPFLKYKQSFQNSRFLGKMSAWDFFCCCRSSVIHHFPLSSQGRTCEKNQILAFFQKQAIFPKFKIFRQNECTRFFGVVGRRSRRSSVISLCRHRDGPVKKIKFSPFFKNKQSFQNSRFLGKMSARDFFLLLSVIRHFPLSSQGRTCEKNQILAVFQKQAIFPKFKIFRQNECTRFFLLMSVVGHLSFPSFVTGTDLWKKSNFCRFSKTSNLSKIQDF